MGQPPPLAESGLFPKSPIFQQSVRRIRAHLLAASVSSTPALTGKVRRKANEIALSAKSGIEALLLSSFILAGAGQGPAEPRWPRRSHNSRRGLSGAGRSNRRGGRG